MYLCDSGHEEICFEKMNCPLCLQIEETRLCEETIHELEKKIEDLEDDIYDLKEKIRDLELKISKYE